MKFKVGDLVENKNRDERLIMQVIGDNCWIMYFDKVTKKGFVERSIFYTEYCFTLKETE